LVFPVLDAIESALKHVIALRDKRSGTLRLNVQRAVAKVLVRPLLPEFLAKYPGTLRAFMDFIRAHHAAAEALTARPDAAPPEPSGSPA
jgi:DNA-binding transcriptional LysR family regulator